MFHELQAIIYADFAHMGVLEDPEQLGTFLSIISARTLLNDRLAGCLNVPYWASAFRAPVMVRIIREKAETRELLDQQFAQIGGAAVGGHDDGPYLRPMSLPPLLALLLEEIHSLDEFWPALEDLRARMTPVRDAIRRDRRDSYGNGRLLLRRYSQRLQEATHDLESYKGAAADVAGEAVGAAVSSVSPLPGVVSPVIKLATKFGVRGLFGAIERLARPDVYVLANVAQEARRLAALDEQLARLWSTRWDRRRIVQLERLALAQPRDFLRLSTPG